MRPDELSLERVGTTIGEKYRLVRLVGSGGMGAVYEAVNTWTERRVAIKLLHRHLITNDGAERFLREARAASRIEHPAVVTVFDIGQDADGSLYIVQEFLTGTDLRHVLRSRGTLSLDEAATILLPVMDALNEAHKLGIVHRDIKPENIFLAAVGRETQPKVIDFGLAKLKTAGGRALTQAGASLGTPYYMAPEQVRANRDIDGRADVWAIGVVFFEMLTGRFPYEGKDVQSVLLKISTESPRRIEQIVPGIPPSIAAVVHRAIEPSIELRFASMEQFAESLRFLRGSAPRISSPAASPSPAVDALAATAAAPSPRPSVRPSGHGVVFGMKPVDASAPPVGDQRTRFSLPGAQTPVSARPAPPDGGHATQFTLPPAEAVEGRQRKQAMLPPPNGQTAFALPTPPPRVDSADRPVVAPRLSKRVVIGVLSGVLATALVAVIIAIAVRDPDVPAEAPGAVAPASLTPTTPPDPAAVTPPPQYGAMPSMPNTFAAPTSLGSACTPQCSQRMCGDSDGCGGYCSDCAAGFACRARSCVATGRWSLALTQASINSAPYFFTPNIQVCVGNACSRQANSTYSATWSEADGALGTHSAAELRQGVSFAFRNYRPIRGLMYLCPTETLRFEPRDFQTHRTTWRCGSGNVFTFSLRPER